MKLPIAPARVNATALRKPYFDGAQFFENAKAEIARPFPKEQELKEKSERLAELNALLDMDHKDNEIDEGEVSSDEPERKERSYAR